VNAVSVDCPTKLAAHEPVLVRAVSYTSIVATIHHLEQ
jgi:hypothetical protein